MVSYADTLDCVGILAGEVEDVREVYGMSFSLVSVSPLANEMGVHGAMGTDVIAQPDRLDSTCVGPSVRRKAKAIEEEARGRIAGLEKGSLEGLRIGIPIVSAFPHPFPKSSPGR